MKFKHHIEIGKGIYEKENLKNRMGITKDLYILGCVAPDFNCIFPPHMLKTTKLRFYTRMRLIERSSNVRALRSFSLGIVTHYMCDYFCFAHNNGSEGKRHKHYERNLMNRVESGNININEDIQKKLSRLCDEYEYTYRNKKVSRMSNELEETLDNNGYSIIANMLRKKDICKYIVKLIEEINKQYREDSIGLREHGWEDNEEQMDTDITYANFVTEYVTNMLVTIYQSENINDSMYENPLELTYNILTQMCTVKINSLKLQPSV